MFEVPCAVWHQSVCPSPSQGISEKTKYNIGMGQQDDASRMEEQRVNFDQQDLKV
jgi:hypothetical protein